MVLQKDLEPGNLSLETSSSEEIASGSLQLGDMEAASILEGRVSIKGGRSGGWGREGRKANIPWKLNSFSV